MSVEAPAKKKAAAPRKPADHPKYIDMIKAAVASLKERNGSSRQAIAKYILANYKVGEVNPHLKMALKRGVASGAILQHKGTGASGSFKLNKAIKEEKKPKKKPVAKKAVKKPAAKKAKKPAAKKAKKPVAKKATPKKPAAKKAAKKPAAKKPVKAKKPAAKKPAAKKSPAKKAAKKPVKKPAASKKK